MTRRALFAALMFRVLPDGRTVHLVPAGYVVHVKKAS